MSDNSEPREYVKWTDRNRDGDEWECRYCHAENHPTYGQCWQCERDQ